MTKEQEESLEKLKRQILIGECEKNIGIPVYISDLKTILFMLEEQDKIIEQMTYYIMNLDIDEDICKEVNCNANSGELDCKDCIKQYFENKVNGGNKR